MTEEETGSSRGRRNKAARFIDEYDLEGLGEEMARRWTAEDDRWSLRDLVDLQRVDVPGLYFTSNRMKNGYIFHSISLYLLDILLRDADSVV